MYGEMSRLTLLPLSIMRIIRESVRGCECPLATILLGFFNPSIANTLNPCSDRYYLIWCFKMDALLTRLLIQILNYIRQLHMQVHMMWISSQAVHGSSDATTNSMCATVAICMAYHEWVMPAYAIHIALHT